MRAFIAGLALMLVGFAVPAHAALITYQVSGTASGSLGGTSFTNASVVFTGTADTANIQSLFGGVVYGVPLDTLMVAIGNGVGTATLTEQAALYSIPIAVIDPQIPPLPGVMLGRLDN